MGKDRIKDISSLVYERTQGGQFRWITISTLLLALGTILHLVSPSIAGATPNWTISMYSVAILLVRPTYKQALGIGFVAAILGMLTSKSAFPYANLISEPLGALTCAVITLAIGNLKIGRFDLKPIIIGFIATLCSGGAFVTTLYVVLNLPTKVLLFAMYPMVFSVAVINAIITPIVFFPAKRFLLARGILNSGEAIVSDHSQYTLVPEEVGQISVEHLTYSYNRAAKPALKDINLAVQKGDFMIITGPSGCGKTTLCMAMVGAVPHFYGGKMKGMTFVDGKATTQTTIADLALHIGAVLADYDTQLVTMTVGEEVAFAMENRGYNEEEIQERTQSVLCQVGLEGYSERKIADMSGGQRQRLAIASVLATSPSILILDEPTSSLDPEGTAELYSIIGTLNKEHGITVVVIDDALDAAIPYANRMALLVGGELLTADSVEDTLNYMYTHNIYPEALPALFRCQKNLEKAGYTFFTPWLSVNEAVADLQNLKGGI